MDTKQLCSQKWAKIECVHDIRCLELNISEACNYRCSYCIFHRNNSQSSMMNPKLATQIAEQFDSYLNGRAGIIYFGAGEPLLNWEAISAVCETLDARNSNIELHFMTNASLLTEDRLRYIAKNNIRVGFSIDGHQKLQNASRPANSYTVDSHEVVINALQNANSIGYQVYSLSATYSHSGFLKDAEYVIGLCKQYNIPEFDLDFDISSLRADNIDNIANELVSCYSKSVSLGLQTFGYWLIPYLNYSKDWMFAHYCGNAVGTNICIAANGHLKICGYDPTQFSVFTDFESIFTDNRYIETLKNYILRSDDCLQCDIFKFCHGQCIFLDPNSTARILNCKLLKKVMELFKTSTFRQNI